VILVNYGVIEYSFYFEFTIISCEFTKYETDGSNPAKPTEKDTQNGSVFILGAKLAF
jgi:hypothetical protein